MVAVTVESAASRTRAVRALEAEFGELLVRIRRIISENANRVSPGMLPAAYKVFTTIVRQEAVTQSALGEMLLADKGQISRTVRELEQLGLVARASDPDDGRSSILSPTAFGLERLAAAREPQEQSLLRSVEGWPLADLENLTRLIHALSTGETPSTPS